MATILFLSGKLEGLGGYALLLVFAVATLLHLPHGQFEISPLFVYGTAFLACLWVKQPAGARSGA